MFLYDGARWLIWLVLHNVWPDYGMLVLDLAATSAVFLDEPETRNWWRMAFAGMLVELMRYGFAHAPHLIWWGGGKVDRSSMGLVGWLCMLAVIPLTLMAGAFRIWRQKRGRM